MGCSTSHHASEKVQRTPSSPTKPPPAVPFAQEEIRDAASPAAVEGVAEGGETADTGSCNIALYQRRRASASNPRGFRASQGSRVRIEGLTLRPDCNGLEGTARKLLPDDRVWVVLVSLCDTSVPSVNPPPLFISFEMLLLMTARGLCRTTERR
jgi:hypothetical protein